MMLLNYLSENKFFNLAGLAILITIIIIGYVDTLIRLMGPICQLFFCDPLQAFPSSGFMMG